MIKVEDLDEYIAENIIKLNEEGIRTFFSCSGLLRDHQTGLKAEIYAKAYDEPKIGCQPLCNTAYLNIDFDSVAPYLRDISMRLAELNYEIRMTRWEAEVDALMDDNDKFTKPTLRFSPTLNMDHLCEEERDWEMMERWSILFQMLFDVVSKNG